MCEVWGVPAANIVFKYAYHIDTPLLIYSGELDPVALAELARPVLENASIWWGKIWSDSSHEVMHQLECADRVAAAFYVIRCPIRLFINALRMADRKLYFED